MKMKTVREKTELVACPSNCSFHFLRDSSSWSLFKSSSTFLIEFSPTLKLSCSSTSSLSAIFYIKAINSAVFNLTESGNEICSKIFGVPEDAKGAQHVSNG